MWVIPTPILVNAEAEPISLPEAKLFLRQDIPDDDTLIQSLITAARQWFEVATDRQFCSGAWRVKLPGFYPGGGSGWPVTAWGVGWNGWGCGPWGRIELPYPPLVSVSSVQYLDAGNVAQTLATTVYNVVTSRTPGAIELAFGQTWPVTYTHPEAVTITFVAGHGDSSQVPELVKAGIKLLMAHWYDHRGDTATVPMAVEAIATASGSKRF